MQSITLDVQSAKLVAKFGDNYGVPDDGGWSITLAVRLPWHERLELGTGEKPDELEMHLTFRRADAELLEWAAERTREVENSSGGDQDKLCGTISYHKAWEDSGALRGRPALISFDIFTPPDVMASLIRFAENGRFVKSVTVSLRGMKYGYAPDGSEKQWPDNDDEKVLPIVRVSYDLPLLEEPERPSEPGAPKTRVGADLYPVLMMSLKWLMGAVWLLVVIAGATVMRNWR